MIPEKTKVCMIVPSFTAKGGITSVVNGYIGSDLEKEYSISYVETYCDGTKYQKLKKALQSYCKFIRLQKKNKFDLLHIHSSFGASFFRKMPFILLAHRKRIPIINHIHGSDMDDLYINAPNWKKKLISNTYNMCNAIIVLSTEQQKKIDIMKIATPKYILANYSTIHDERHNFGNNKVLFLGFLTELKGCYDIPRVVSWVVKKNPGVIFLLGGVGEKEIIERKAFELGVQNNIVFLGWISGKEKEELFLNSDIFFLPSYTEAMPVSILEAMGYGLPIVASNVGGIPQLVKENQNGYLYNPGDCKGMADGIIRILNNKTLQEKLASASYTIAKTSFSKETHINNLKHIYKTILENRKKLQFERETG